MPDSYTVAAFVDDVRHRRVAAGLPEKIDDRNVYALLDGLLARHQKGGGPDAT